MIHNWGGKIPPLRLFIQILFLFSYVYSQYFSSRIFPSAISLENSNPANFNYISYSEYDNIYKKTIRDTVRQHIYNMRYSHSVTLPVRDNSSLILGQSFVTKYARDTYPQLRRDLYTKQKYKLYRIGYTRSNSITSIYFNYEFTPHSLVQNKELSINARIWNVNVGLTYLTKSKMTEWKFIDDSTNYSINNYHKYDRFIIQSQFKGENINVSLVMSRNYPKNNKSQLKNDLGLEWEIYSNMLESSVEYKFRNNLSFWAAFKGVRDTSNVPIYWEAQKIGKFTAMDDTTLTIRAGIKYFDHQISIGGGYGNGLIKFYSATYPFSSIWESLSGTRYYYRLSSELTFQGLFYSNRRSFYGLNTLLNLSAINITGIILNKQYTISWINPSQLLPNSKDITIHQITLIESMISLEKDFGEKFSLKFNYNILIPLIVDITSSSPPAKSGNVNQNISGGMRFSLRLSYQFK